MSGENEIIVVGGGPAGIAASLALAQRGARVLLVEQRDRLGGAIHRQAAPGVAKPIAIPAGQRRQWHELATAIARQPNTRQSLSTVFAGIDATGLVLLDDRTAGRVMAIRPRALILATGAIERIHPFPGWELPGVMSAGGAQVLLKETGEPPPGPILVAGSGPLLLAVAAQLAAAGAPPRALLERGRPHRQFAALLRAGAYPAKALEAAFYASRLVRGGVPVRFGTFVLEVEQLEDGLAVTLSDGSRQVVRTLIVHDGLDADPLAMAEAAAPFPLHTAGDGREVLGASGVVADGQRAAHLVAAALGLGGGANRNDHALNRARAFQANLARLYGHAAAPLVETTMLCRCEGKRLADLRSLPDGISAREAKLVGRFGMGACQGRFCARHIAELTGGLPNDDFRATLPRWPLRPVSLAALAHAELPADLSRSTKVDET